MTKIKLGAKYKHFKGGEYRVHDLGKFADDKSEVVIYESLTHGGMWVRRASEFIEHVDRPEYNYSGPRFVEMNPPTFDIGDYIELVKMEDDPDPIEVGARGTVTSVLRIRHQDLPETYFEQVGVAWDNGRTLDLIMPPDVAKLIESAEE